MPKFRISTPDGKTYEINAPEGATQDQVLTYAQSHHEAQPTEENKPKGVIGTLLDYNTPKNLGNFAAGAARGAAGIGATIAQPFQYLANGALGNNAEMRGNIDKNLASMGADTESSGYKTGKLGADIALTAPIGGGLGKLVGKVAPALGESIASGGMSLGNAATGSKIANALMRVGGGAINGAATAGMVDPESAGTGAMIGGALPVVAKVAGEVGNALNNSNTNKYAEALSKFNRQEPMRDTLKESIDAGYVVPPNLVNPSTKNAIIESISGKQATGQLASVRNQDVTEKLVRQSLGLADDVPLNKSALEQMRKIEGGAYKKVADLSPEAMINLESLKQARNDAQGWFNAYNRSASPEDLAKAKSFRSVANDFETQLEKNASDAGQDNLIPALRDARKQIAKTYTVERALNDGAGTVNAKVIGRMYDKGSPLSDGLDTVGKFASTFPSVNQASQQMGSPAAHNLRSMASLLMGGAGGAAMGPAGIAAAALPYATGSASRALMFGKGAQNALSNQLAPTLSTSKSALIAELLKNPKLINSAEVLSSQ
jgi:hypothetical protein